MQITDAHHLFDIPDGLTYLDCAAQSPALRASREAGERGLQRKFHPWSKERSNLNGEIDQARELFGKLIGAPAGDIAHMSATSYGAAIAGANLRLAPGQEIIVLEMQFPSNYYVWQRVAARDGGTVKVIPWPKDGDWTAAILAGLSQTVGIVALPLCHWTDGALIDLQTIAERVHDIGAAFFIDATQSVGAHPFDVASLNPDYVAVSGYKWLLCPDAVGFLYVAPRNQNGQPIEDNYGSRIADSAMETSDGYGSRYLQSAARFDQGAADSMIHLPMTVTALEQLNRWTPTAISASITPLTDRIAALATDRGWQVPEKSRRSGHFTGVWIDNVPGDLDRRLRARDIHISLRGGAVRISPYLFNDLDDIDRLFHAIDAELGR